MSHAINLHDIDLRLLRVFKAVVEFGGFAAAELELNINRSTISTHLSDLETRLGMRLCNRGRGRSPFSLTEQGAEVFETVKELFDYLDSFSNRVNAIQTELVGKLRIALPDDWLQLTQVDLAPAIARFREKAPRVELEIMAHAINEIDFDILNNRADIAINVIQQERPGLEYQFLYRHHTSLYCGDKHPLFSQQKITRKQLLQEALVGNNHSINKTIHQLCQQFPKRAIANHMSGRTLLILSGTYVGFLPDYYAQTWIDSGQLRRIDVKGFDYELDNAVIYRKDTRHNALVDLFVEEIFRQVEE